MNDELSFVVTTHSPDETVELGSKVGHNLKGGEVIELISDLGGGKTTFVKGLASGMESMDIVTSPSFTLINEYKSNDIVLYHYDLYRLKEIGTIGQELSDMMQDEYAAFVIEWPQLIENILPAKRVKIKISNVGQEDRLFKFSFPKEYDYLISPNN